MTIRYLQKQVNEVCLAFKKEQNLSEQFRDEFKSLRTFKFFTEKLLHDLDNKTTTLVDELKDVKEQVDR